MIKKDTSKTTINNPKPPTSSTGDFKFESLDLLQPDSKSEGEYTEIGVPITPVQPTHPAQPTIPDQGVGPKRIFHQPALNLSSGPPPRPFCLPPEAGPSAANPFSALSAGFQPSANAFA